MQVAISPHIAAWLDIVGVTVQLDDQLVLTAEEVRKEGAYRHLSAELCSKL